MTLVVSLRVPDGVVVAADSLQTTLGMLVPGLKDFKIKNPKSGDEINIAELNFPPIRIPTSTTSYAQKLFSFCKNFGVATFGSSIIGSRTIYNHIKNLETTLSKPPNSVSEASDIILKYFDTQTKEQLIKDGNPKLQPNAFLVGFQIVGYESNKDFIGKTIEVTIGTQPSKSIKDGIGCTVSGDISIVQKLWAHDPKNTNEGTIYGSFSLQDAVDYAEFLIVTTSNYQRFANMIPTVGGEVDIALITNYNQFTWIKCKQLTKIIEKYN